MAIVTSFPDDPDNPCGGVEAVSVHLARALTRIENLSIDIVTLDDTRQAAEVRQWEGARIHRVPCNSRSMLGRAIGGGRTAIKAYLTQLAPDVVHSHDVYGLMVKGLPLPRVFTVHGFIHDDTLVSASRFRRLRAGIWKWVETAGWADQPCVISISPYVREKLTRHTSAVIRDIDNPISERFFNVDRRENETVIYSAAAICRRKNTLGLVAGFKRLVDRGVRARLRLSGGAPEPEYKERVHRFVKENGLEGSVELLGRVDYEQIFDELAQAAVFALVSYEENSPMGIEEAMAAGIPVVTSNRCGMPYMVRHGESGFLVNPDDPEDIARRFAQLLADGELRSKMGRAGRRIAEDRFHPARVAQRTAEVYREIAKSSVNTPA